MTEESRNPLANVVAGMTAGAVIAGLWWVGGRYAADRIRFSIWPIDALLRALSDLSRRGELLPTCLAFIAIGASLGAIGGAVLWLRLRGYDRSLAEQCELMGFTLLATVTRSDLPDLPLFRNWSSACNRMTGERDGWPVELVDFTSVVEGKETDGEKHVQYEDRTIVLVFVERLPDFDLTPKQPFELVRSSTPTDLITSDAPHIANGADVLIREQFERFFQLSAGFSEDQTRFAEDVFTPRVMDRMTRSPGWSIQARNGIVALWRGVGFHSYRPPIRPVGRRPGNPRAPGRGERPVVIPLPRSREAKSPVM